MGRPRFNRYASTSEGEGLSPKGEGDRVIMPDDAAANPGL